MRANETQKIEQAIAVHLDREELQQAATVALRGYGPQIWSYLATLLRDPAVADEVFAQFSECLWKGIGGFRRESSFLTWAYKLAWHAARGYQRDPYRRRSRRLETGELSAIAESVRMSTAVHLKTESRDLVSRLRQSLDPEEQTLLSLRIDRKLSWKDVAFVMSEEGQVALDEATLRMRFERVKSKLRSLANEAERAEGRTPPRK
jgi:RNA polymerase sigma-70 factor (ECF subfamily)